MEFTGSRLLAIAFFSMSSPDLGIRQLAYDTLDKFKNALEVVNVFMFVITFVIIYNFTMVLVGLPVVFKCLLSFVCLSLYILSIASIFSK